LIKSFNIVKYSTKIILNFNLITAINAVNFTIKATIIGIANIIAMVIIIIDAITMTTVQLVTKFDLTIVIFTIVAIINFSIIVKF